MTESTDTITNYSRSDSDNDDYPIDLFVVPIHQQEHIGDDFGLFDDDDDEDNLTLFDLKPTPKFDHDLSIFDELAHQCDAVLLETNSQQKPTVSTTSNNNSYSSNLTTTTATMINDYERRFQRSLQKLTIPSWYIDTAPSPKLSTKPLIISTSHYSRESHRTPEIVHVHRPHSYRSCRSSLGTSPSPSLHSWHPNHMMDGMNFSPLLPSSSSTSRRHNKYEKGIQRVTKSSHWYQPTQFVDTKENDQISTSKVLTIDQKNSEYNHYDIPKFHYDDNNNNLSNNIKQNLIPDKNFISRLSIQRQSNCLIDDIDFDDVENTSITKENNNNDKGNISMTHDKQRDNHIKSNEFQIMPLANEKISFGRVELEEITDEEENDKRSSTNNIHIPSTVEEYNDDETNTSLERLASNLVDSILNDVLLLKNLDHDDDTNTGVRELSDDENGLRELDENDMSGTDEFIVFATKAGTSDDDDDDANNTNNTTTTTNNNDQTSPTINRGSLNRLYTFSRTNDDGTINNSKKLPSNQDSSTSVLMIIDKDISTTDTDQEQTVHTMVDLDNNDSNNSIPIYRSHIQKRHINLGRYYDGMMRGKNSQLPTHDLRCNLSLTDTNQPISSDGVTEETVRKGRILLDSIPTPIELKNQLNENVNNQSVPVRSILKNTRFAVTDEVNDKKLEDHILTIEEKEKISPRKIVTTITEEYHRIHRKIIEEFVGELNEKICRDSVYSSNQEQVNTQQSLKPSVPINDQSPYELLSECYSGYSYMRNHFLIPIKAPLTSNVSSLQTTTDEAYDSERTTTASPRSPTMSSSTAATTTHIHPELEHEFEYPTPPPPVPDRRLKPAHLRPPPPPTKPRSHKQEQKDSDAYSKIQKQTKASPLAVIQHLMASTPNEPTTSSSTRTLSSRHYCGSLPVSSEPITSSSHIKTDEISKQNSKKLINSSINDNNNNNQQIIFKKSSSSSSSLNKTKTKKLSSTYFDEATNGLAIRLPASVSNGHDSTNKQNPNRASTPSSTKRADGTTKTRPMSENLNSDRSSMYETSV